MSLKRALYKPAPQDNVGTAERRKPLAQGRLMTKSQEGADGVPSPADVQWDMMASSRHDGSLSHSNVTATVAHSPKSATFREPRRNLSALMRTDGSARSEHGTSPRRETPHASLQQSPKPLKPSMSLELSDTDTDLSLQRTHNQTDQVLLIDASRQTKSLNDSEVDIKFGFKHSPAKVICHSPSKVHGDLRDTGDVGQAAQVSMDHVPSVSILAEADSFSSGACKSAPIFKSPLVVNEKKSPGVVQSLTSRLMLEADASDGYHNLVGQAKGGVVSGEEADLESLVGSNISGVSSISMVSAMSSMHEDEDVDDMYRNRVNTAKEVKTAVERMAGAKSKSLDMRVKKKKVGRMPESRYMLAAASVGKGPMKATDRSILTKSSVQASSLSVAKPSKRGTPSSSKHHTPSSSKTKPSKTGSSKKKAGSTSVHFSTTPETRGKGGKSSTPTADNVTLSSHVVDVSAIAPPSHHHSSVYGTPTLSDLNSTGDSPPHRPGAVNMARLRDRGAPAKRGSSGDRSRNVTAPSQRDNSHVQDSSTVDKNGKRKITQLDLDIPYARYFQWVFLASKAEKTFQEQEKNFMAQCSALWEENEAMARQKAQLERQLARLKHLNSLDETLDIQQSGLGPVVHNLEQLSLQMSTLSQSLDTTRHQMPVKGVHIPDDTDVYQAQLLTALSESQQLLGELSVMTRQPTPKVSSFAKLLATMEITVTQEAKDLSKCGELMAAAHSLSTQETSLQLHDMLNCS